MSSDIFRGDPMSDKALTRYKIWTVARDSLLQWIGFVPIDKVYLSREVPSDGIAIDGIEVYLADDATREIERLGKLVRTLEQKASEPRG